MDGTVFYFVGGALVVAALVLSYVGIKGKASFPPNSRTFLVVSAVFALLVIVTAAYAVANAREEQEEHQEELAHEAELAESEAAPAPGGSPSGEPAEPGAAAPGEQGAPPSTGGEALELTSPEDGSLAFEPPDLSASAGPITIAYANPSPVPHNVNLEDDAGETLEESEDVTEGEVEISAELVPGEYIYYCSIPGHREGGMEGALTVE